MAIPPFGAAPTPDATPTKKGKIKLAGDFGGTSDSPTVTFSNDTIHTLKSTLTTKGDIYAASAASTPARLGVGSAGQAIVPDSSQSTGLLWRDITEIGLLSARPSATTANTGMIYAATDNQTVYRSNGSTWDSIASVSTNVPNFGAIYTIGHSYTQLDDSGSALGVANFVNYTHRIASWAHISSDETRINGRSGAMLCAMDLGDNENQGLGTILNYVYPNHWYQPQNAPRTVTDAVTNSTTTLTSATANFNTGADKGRRLTGSADLPADTFIVSVTNSTTVVMNNAATGSHSGQTVTISPRPINSKPAPGVFILNYGYNEAIRNGDTNSTIGPGTFTNHLTVAAARIRCKQLYNSVDGSIAYSGFSTTVTDSTATTGQYRKSQTNGDTFTINVPKTFRGGTVDIFLRGATNTIFFLNGNMNNTDVSTTVAVKSGLLGAGGYLATSTNDVIIVGTEQMLITGGAGTNSITVTRGFNSTTKTTHSTGDTVTIVRGANTHITWSGTATGATGTTYTDGLGFADTGASSGNLVKSDGMIVKRFTLTAADAGSTIIGTVGGYPGSSANEFVGLDSWGVEDDNDAPYVLIVNQTIHAGVAGGSVYNESYWNPSYAAAAGAFSSGVTVVDVKTTLDAYYKATLNGAISTTNGTSVPITVNDATNTKINVGSIMYCGSEEMLVTAIGSFTGSNVTLTVQRGYNGTTAATHSNGVNICDMEWLNGDRVHPSDKGHEVYAQVAITTLLGLTQTTSQAATASAYVLRRQQTFASGYNISVRGQNAQGSYTPTADRLVLTPLYFPVEGVINRAAIWVVTGVAATTVRLGLYTDVNGGPGYLLFDTGDLASTSSGALASATVDQPIKPGWYWTAFLAHGGTPAVRGMSYPFSNYAIPLDDSEMSGTASLPTGFFKASITGSLPSSWTYGNGNTVHLSGNTALPVIHYRLTTEIH